MAVTKTFPAGAILDAKHAGIADIGENYVQEMLRKRNELQDEEIRWHFIGHLQRNKVRELAGWSHMIHSVDSLRLGEEISRQAQQAGRTIEVLVEVNTSGEKSKFGVLPADAPSLVRALANLPGLRVSGLMTIGPLPETAEGSRPAFRSLREIHTGLEDEGMRLHHLSMGMSTDFEVAVEEGATIVRIGTALFGPRYSGTPA